ncbi:MAG: hypothetical protein A2915_00380 [Candidatus Yanofskybacteria bacterium RIFCSPLOWO2_01_FULL_41_34]|uniref:Uncharacterized protein n=1 Tax=Candidatus Yanofskybacteria bacterium RIFCSPHIGHO2_01_FULL_41_26 TaxID=1802661 RepID=A0A1F8ECD3_9BACT|nr:MAG: hypothetical protein A2649_02415 [Candidatus Yanofskybacteria bacterium RIFCSPHIGHO2_01_FULL_41_26]OGN22358.1 MAG: hypothetical protein A2915_00380 [Candidatus Yanofskybacteria bacterium RIFCSPLOWO2_01_FULL_41_34]
MVYHDDFLTPGKWPALANSRKCILHKPKLLIYPPFLPHIKHLRTIRVEYLGFLFDLAIVDFLGMLGVGSHISRPRGAPFSSSLSYC